MRRFNRYSKARFKPLAPAVALSALLSGCAGSGGLVADGTKIPSVETGTGVATCQAAKDILTPFVVEWPATAKTTLDATLQRGIVVVSYAGCTMKVLDGCEAGGSYTLRSTTPVRDTIDIDNVSKLYTHLPLGAATLKGKLERGGALALHYVSVGQQIADGQPQQLRGSCAGATHFVRSVTVGAYSLTLSQERGAGGEVDTMWKGGMGADMRSRKHQIRASGNPEVCMTSPDDPVCKAILQVNLMALEQQDVPTSTTESSFGRGLGGLVPLPQIEKMATVDLDSGLEQADVALLRKVQEAKRTERDAGVNSEGKRQVWLSVVEYSPQHVFRRSAEQRANQWGEVAIAEALRARKAASVCERHVRDVEKLKNLTSFDDDVVTQEQKHAYQQEFDRAYAPFQEVLADCGGWTSKAQEKWVEISLARYERERRQREHQEEQQHAKALTMGGNEADWSDGDSDTARDKGSTTVRTAKTVSIVFGGVLTAAGAGTYFGAGGYYANKAKEGCSSNGVCPSININDSRKAKTAGWLGIGAMGLGVAVGLGGLFWPVPKEDKTGEASTGWQWKAGPGDIGIGTGVNF